MCSQARGPGRVWVVLIALACTGCGGQKTYPVEGTVVWPDGAPAKELAGGMVQFDLVTDAKDRVSPQGEIRPDGSFKLTTFKTDDGAPPGKYRVLVMPVVWTEGMLAGKAAPPPVLAARFQQFETSGLEQVVEPKSNTVTIKVERYRK